MSDTVPTTRMPAAVANAEMGTLVMRAIYAVVALDIPDLLADGALPAAELAGRCGARQQMLTPILRAVTAAGLMATDSDGRIALTDVGHALCSDHPSASRDHVLTFGGPMFYDGLGAIVETVRTGRTGIEITTGQPGFECLAARPEEGASFNRAMITVHGHEPAAIAAAYDFTDAGHVVDVGGGIGTLLEAVLTAYPDTTGTLFDRPDVVSAARRELAKSPAADRCTFSAGDFFDGVPGGGDVYLLSHILHDWDDETCLTILRRCREAMSPGGRLLVIDAVLPEGDEPHPAEILGMLIATLFGGKERTESEFAGLFAAARLRLTRIVPVCPTACVIEAGIGADR